MTTAPQKPRLVLYGIGQYGQMMVRLAAKKGWPIVAAFNRAGPKVGQDVGRLAGLGSDYGVRVQDCDAADYSKLAADAAIVTMYDKLKENFPAYERLLGAGLNVVCHGSESYYPQVSEPDVAAQIEKLAKAKGVTFVGTGVWDMSRIWSALLIAGNCDEIHSVHNSSLTILDSFGESIMLNAGVGMTPEEFYEKVACVGGIYSGYYRFAPLLVLHALGFHATQCRYTQEPLVLDQPFYCAALRRELQAGRCEGMRTIVTVDTAEGVTATTDIVARIRHDGDVEHTKWIIKGEPLSPEVYVTRDNGHYMQALSTFNRVKDAIDAPPGLQLLTDLGPMRWRAG